MKKSELFFNFLLLPVDYLMVVTAGILAYSLRFESFLTAVRPVIYALPFEQYLRIVVVMAFGWVIIFALAGLYATRGSRRFRHEAARILLACSTATLAVIVWVFFFREELFSSRFIILAVWIISIVTVLFGRGVVRLIQRLAYRVGYGVRQVAVFGRGHIAKELITAIEQHRGLGFRLVKQYDNFSDATAKELAALRDKRQLDEILQLDPDMDREAELDLVAWARAHHVVYRYTPDLFQAKATNIDIATLAGVPVIEIRRTRLEGWGRIIKRIFDFLAAVILIVIFSPIMLLIAIAIALDSPGGIIYKNQRLSKDGVFTTYKFRSMKREYCTGPGYGGKKAEELEKELIEKKSQRQGPVYKVLDDPRRTRVGRFLERTSLDELPQFFNVLLGTMSLVGPRPHQPREVEKYQRHHRDVLAIKPGVTGLAQISGRSDLDFDEEVKLDVYYIEHWSLLLDIWIILRTPWAIISRTSNV